MTARGILLVADDLSGAADCAVAFAVRGMHSTVGLTDAEEAPPGPVTVVDTDSRHADPGEARRRVAAALLRRGAGRLLFKKLDSTLRGNLVAELDALRAHGGGTWLVVCAPAVPATGRTVRDGVLRVHGVPLHETAAWAAEPVPAPRTVGQALRPLPVRAVPLRVVRGPRNELTELLASCGREGRIAVCDAETDEDLRAVTTAGLALPHPPRWAGAAGLAEALAATLAGGQPVGRPCAGARAGASRGQAGGVGPGGRPGTGVLGDPGHPGLAVGADGADRADGTALCVLTVVGSASPVSAAQADELARRCPDRTLALTAREALDGPAAAHADRLAGLLPQRGEALLRLVPDGPPDAAVARRLAERLGEIAAPAARRADVLVLTGGETARAVLTRSGVRALEILAEPAPGTVLARALPSRGPRCRLVVTKAGGAGTPRTLADALTAVTDRTTPPDTTATAATAATALEETP